MASMASFYKPFKIFWVILSFSRRWLKYQKASRIPRYMKNLKNLDSWNHEDHQSCGCNPNSEHITEIQALPYLNSKLELKPETTGKKIPATEAIPNSKMSDSQKPCKILITSVDQYGHVNPCLGLGSLLVEHGLQVFFLNRSKYRAETECQGITFLAAEDYTEPGQEDPEIAGSTIQFVQSFGQPDMAAAGKGPLSANLKPLLAEMKYIDAILRKAYEMIKPDLIIGDFLLRPPFVQDCPVPFVPFISHAPLNLYNQPETGKTMPDEAVKSTKGTDLIEKWFRENGPGPLSAGGGGKDEVKYFGIYMYPEAVDYKELGSPKKGWLRLDSALRILENLEFEIPESLKSKPGKLIFLSLGSFGSANLVLMRRLIATLSKSPHRFIVSKGPLGDQLELPGNMWGQNYLNQLAVLSKVDLVITHGGNNTFVEALYFGKPMIAIPLMVDQFDNAQRLEDLKLGRRFDGFNYQDGEFLQAIEDILGDSELSMKMAQISESIRNSKSSEKIVAYIEQLARTGVSPV